jgi:hypothetical protein
MSRPPINSQGVPAPSNTVHASSSARRVANRVDLCVTFKEKLQAKRFGAQWDPEAKTWYAKFAEPDLVNKWGPDSQLSKQITQLQTSSDNATFSGGNLKKATDFFQGHHNLPAFVACRSPQQRSHQSQMHSHSTTQAHGQTSPAGTSNPTTTAADSQPLDNSGRDMARAYAGLIAGGDDSHTEEEEEDVNQVETERRLRRKHPGSVVEIDRGHKRSRPAMALPTKRQLTEIYISSDEEDDESSSFGRSTRTHAPSRGRGSTDSSNNSQFHEGNTTVANTDVAGGSQTQSLAESLVAIDSDSDAEETAGRGPKWTDPTTNGPAPSPVIQRLSPVVATMDLKFQDARVLLLQFPHSMVKPGDMTSTFLRIDDLHFRDKQGSLANGKQVLDAIDMTPLTEIWRLLHLYARNGRQLLPSQTRQGTKVEHGHRTLCFVDHVVWLVAMKLGHLMPAKVDVGLVPSRLFVQDEISGLVGEDDFEFDEGWNGLGVAHEMNE